MFRIYIVFSVGLFPEVGEEQTDFLSLMQPTPKQLYRVHKAEIFFVVRAAVQPAR